MNPYWEHFKTITKHKYYVFKECYHRGLFWQGIIHDLSKYSPTEFFESAEHFQGNKSPVQAAKDKYGYSLAWLHHKSHNRHHWDYWVDFKNGSPYAVEMPEKYVVEACCDMIGASKAYLKTNYDAKEPLKYFDAHSPFWLMHPNSRKKLRELLYNASL